MRFNYTRYLIQPLFTVLILILGVFIYGKLIGPISISINEQNPKRTFETEGVGTVNISPNSFQTEFTINETGNTQKDAQNKGNQKSDEAISLLTQIGIPKNNIKTTGYYINPEYDYSSGRNIIGYNINIQTTVKSSDLNKINAAIDKLTGLGINVGGVNQTIDNEEKYKDEARNKAVEQAKKKAESLAKAGGFKLGKIASIKEIEQPEIRPLPVLMEKSTGSAASGTNIQPGTNVITSRVSIAFFIND
ncbi:SIMPL domain-containing protein [Patescibacteria group bacterium]|nr:SIMPL domain-containing protein [Patescibacteria group bacterium]